MKAKATQLVITLEEDEVWTFWNIVLFALDLLTAKRQTKRTLIC